MNDRSRAAPPLLSAPRMSRLLACLVLVSSLSVASAALADQHDDELAHARANARKLQRAGHAVIGAGALLLSGTGATGLAGIAHMESPLGQPLFDAAGGLFGFGFPSFVAGLVMVGVANHRMRALDLAEDAFRRRQEQIRQLEVDALGVAPPVDPGATRAMLLAVGRF